MAALNTPTRNQMRGNCGKCWPVFYDWFLIGQDYTLVRLYWEVGERAQFQLISKLLPFHPSAVAGTICHHMTPYVTYHQGGGLIKSNCVMGQQNQIAGQQCKIKLWNHRETVAFSPRPGPVQEPYGGVCCCLTSDVTSSKNLWCHLSQVFHTSFVITKITIVIQYSFLVTDIF